MACKYTYQGKTYEAWEFVDVLAQMPATELMRYLPDEARNELVMASSKNLKDWHYSQLTKAIESASDKVFGQAVQVKNWLESNAGKLGVKKDELQWTGILDWLDLQGKNKITKSDVLNYLDNNGVQIQEVMKGGDGRKLSPQEWAKANYPDVYEKLMDAQRRGDAEDVAFFNQLLNREYSAGMGRIKAEGETKYHSYTLPGGENYRELLLTLPVAVDNSAQIEALREKFIRARSSEAEAIKQELAKLKEAQKASQYKSSHWDEANILAHIRFDDRVDADGNRVLMIQEIQSDWGQEGKKKGFSEGKATEEEKRRFAVLDRMSFDEMNDSERIEYDQLLVKVEGAKNIPSAPFVTDTKAWVSLALKRMIAYAVEKGYDKVAFVNGEQSADRYDLSKQISRVEWKTFDGEDTGVLLGWDKNGNGVLEKEIPASEVEDHVGKEIANKLINGPVDHETARGRKVRMVSGTDLKVGGEGMKSFYDRIVPQVANDVLKKIGGKVEIVAIPGAREKGDTGTVGRENPFMTIWPEVGDDVTVRNTVTGVEAGPFSYDEAKAYISSELAKEESTTQLGFTITPEMRQKVEGGLPLFSKRLSDTIEFRSDIPNDRWLSEQIDYARSQGRNQFGVPYMGKTTGYFRGGKTPFVNVSLLAQLNGERGEQSNVRNEDLDWLVGELKENGLQNTGVPYIEVGYDGVPWVSEGNHRIMAAQQLGWESMPVEIRYFDGGERVDGLLAPDRVLHKNELYANDANIMASVSFNPASYAGKIQSATPKITSVLRDVFNTHTTFNWWHRTFGSQRHKAQVDSDYGKVFDQVSSFEQDIARFASEAADLAPDLVPKMDTLGEAWAQRKIVQNTQDFNAVSPWVWFGTLAGINLSKPEHAHYLSDPAALIAKYGDLLPKNQPLKPLTNRQIELMQQFHTAVDFSLDTLAKSEMTRMAKISKLQEADPALSMRDTASFYFDQVAGEMSALEVQINDLKQQQKSERELLEDAGNDEASNAEQRKTYAKLLMETVARHNAEMEPLQEKLAGFKSMVDSFVGKANQIEKLKSEGYAPLMRFGKFTVDVAIRDKEGKAIKDNDGNDLRAFFGMFESESEANMVAREMREMYPDHTVTQGVLSEKESSMFQRVTPETAEAFANMMGMESDEAFQKYLKIATANRSAMKRLIHRKGTAGFSFDVTRALASFITSNSRAASANMHLGDIVKSIADIKPEKGDVKDEAIELLNFVKNPQEKGLAIRSFMFFQFLGGSVAAAAVNLTQTFTTTLPYLSKDEFGGAKKAASEITKAMRDATNRMHKKGYSLGDPELDAALKLAEEEGVVSPHQIHMLRGEASRGSSRATQNIVWRMMENKVPQLRYTSRLLDAFGALWGGFFSLAEQYNRQVAFIAAYRMAKDNGKSADQAFEIAKNAVQETQFDYTKSSRSNFGRGVVGSTVLTFKSFLINYLEFLLRLAQQDKKSATIALGVLFLLAGAQGLPGADDLDDVVDTLGQALGYSTNTKQWKRELLSDAFGNGEFGKHATNFLLHGTSAFLPLDISGRLSVGNIIPASGMLKKSDSGAFDDAMEVIGPVGGFTQKIVEGTKSVIGGGSLVKAATETVAPKAMSDAVKAIDMYQTGVYRDMKGRKIVDVSLGDAAIKAIGFQPNSVAEVRRVERLIQQDITLYRRVKTDVAEMWARGIFEGDSSKITKAQEQIREWEEKNPDRPIKGTAGAAQRRANEMRKLSSERIIKAAPKEIRSSVANSLRAE